MVSMKAGFFALAASLSLSACGWGLLTPRETDPVIEDYIQTGMTRSSMLGILSTTASRRTVMMRLNPDGVGVGRFGQICAEPPADVADAIVRTTSAELTAKASGSGVDAGFAAGLAAGTAISPLLHRSQGLQLYRDGLHGLCQDLLNEVIDQQEYQARKSELLAVAARLISEEIKVMPLLTKPLAPPGQPSPQASSQGGRQ